MHPTIAIKLLMTLHSTIIIAPDGGVAVIDHEPNCPIVTTYYQTRLKQWGDLEALTDSQWEYLGDGKAYHKDWDDKHVTLDMIHDACAWLGYPVQ